MVLPARSGSGSPEELRFPTHMDILDPSVSRWTSANELAANRWSQFAIAAGVFALIPNWSSAEEKDRLQILVGERDEARLSEECESGESLKWLFLRRGKDWLELVAFLLTPPGSESHRQTSVFSYPTALIRTRPRKSNRLQAKSTSTALMNALG